MSLRKEYVRDGDRRVVGTITEGFSDQSSIVRDSEGRITGRTSDRYENTRDRDGGLVSTNTSDPGLLIRKK
jgi:hypothetical protein